MGRGAGRGTEEKMERMHNLCSVTAALLLVCFSLSSEPCDGCASDQEGCKSCILKQLDCGCPECRPALGCLAGCLWKGVSQSKCVKTCDSHKGKPRLSYCKKCMSECECSCVGGGRRNA